MLNALHTNPLHCLYQRKISWDLRSTEVPVYLSSAPSSEHDALLVGVAQFLEVGQAREIDQARWPAKPCNVARAHGERVLCDGVPIDSSHTVWPGGALMARPIRCGHCSHTTVLVKSLVSVATLIASFWP